MGMTTAVLRQDSRHVDQPGSIAAGLSVIVLGSLNFPLLPMVVGAITDHLTLSTRQVGLIASADMTGMFLSALCALYWIRRFNWRVMALGLALGLVSCDVVSAYLESFWPLLVVRLLAGFCGGSMMALGGTAITDAIHSERNVAMMAGLQMAIASAGFLIMPALIQKHGTAGAFLFLAATVLPAVLAARKIPASGRWPRKDSVAPALDPEVPSVANWRAIGLLLFATLPAFLFHLAYAASWAYMERLGVSSGLTLEAVGEALSGSFALGILGSVAAWLIGVRLGRLLPCGITWLLQLLSLGALFFVQRTPIVYVVALMVYGFCLTFSLPRMLSFALINDRTGRATVVFLLMLKAGIAIGPFFASNFVSRTDFTAPLVIAAIFYSLCFLNLFGVARTHPAPATR